MKLSDCPAGIRKLSCNDDSPKSELLQSVTEINGGELCGFRLGCSGELFDQAFFPGLALPLPSPKTDQDRESGNRQKRWPNKAGLAKVTQHSI